MDFIVALHDTQVHSLWGYSCYYFVFCLPPQGALIAPVVSCYGDGLHLKGKHQLVTSCLPSSHQNGAEAVTVSLKKSQLVFFNTPRVSSVL